jgi:hypothetical protein
MGFPGLHVQDLSTKWWVTELLVNDPNENRILLHSLLKEIQEWVAAMGHSGGAMDNARRFSQLRQQNAGLAQIDTVAHKRTSYAPTSAG